MLGKKLPRRRRVVPGKPGSGWAELARRPPQNPLEEIRRQNQELLKPGRVVPRQEELTQLNRELTDTNRGVVALFAELDEKADLSAADQSRFLSNMSHEFRTPLNSIISLARILQDRLDGDSAQQEKQVIYIRKAAEELSELVNDLLDLAKVEAGKVVLRPQEFQVTALLRCAACCGRCWPTTPPSP